MDNNNQQEQREQALSDLLERAGAYEEMTRTKGWEWVLANFKTRVQVFTTNVLTSDQPIEKFEKERQQIIGIKAVIGDVQSDLEALERHRKERDDQQSKEA